MPDEIFAHPTLATIYDDLDGERDDLDLYVAVVDEFGARSVLDVGCGTGVLACRLGALGIDVAGVDPAHASLDVARRRSGSERVRWILGDATTIAPMTVDLVTMTGNVAQVFLHDDDWMATLRGIRGALTTGGRFVFETRDPAQQAWQGWNPDSSTTTRTTVLGRVESWVETTRVEPPIVTFRWTYRFLDDGRELTSDSTLRFRGLDEIIASLDAAGFAVDDVRDAPDRPGLEFVVVAQAVGRSAEQ